MTTPLKVDIDDAIGAYSILGPYVDAGNFVLLHTEETN